MHSLVTLTIALSCLLAVAGPAGASQRDDQQAGVEFLQKEDNLTLSQPVDQPTLTTDRSTTRQQFKIISAPSPSMASKRSMKFISGAHQQLVAASLRRREAAAAAASASEASAAQNQAVSPSKSTQLKQQVSKQTISNAKLKKLLSQSLLKSNGSSTGSSAGSNFKFVFIQRATAAPATKTSKPSENWLTKKSPNGNSSLQLPQQSLASSISKQLANSLFYSAANLVGNLTSPSLTALVSQTISSSTSSSSSTTSTTSTSTTTTSTTSTTRKPSSFAMSDSSVNEIKRVSSLSSQSHGTKGRKKGPAGTKSRPSKIYNLPVKFVANGQPNHVVFSSIKQHFATIKRIQQVASKVSSLSASHQDDGGLKSKRRKQHKFKGNSRLIYLPLKYLSNARPNKVFSISKAAHKAQS